ncbi:MAG: c-type cytochrome [Deltaproteobacteria bacterium]|nr:c-type cytochrome [Deltaproteobacteria bacterium]TLN01914.1 MAG: c-type cytochrome [bacterium]
MNGKILIGLAILAVSGNFLGGCKKESAEKPAAPEQATAPAPVPTAEAKTGEELFGQHCTVCHPAGGNIINPEKPLHRKKLEANGIKTADDIIATLRNPGPGMNKFDEKTISDQDAQAIAEYVLKTFQ